VSFGVLVRLLPPSCHPRGPRSTKACQNHRKTQLKHLKTHKQRTLKEHASGGPESSTALLLFWFLRPATHNPTPLKAHASGDPESPHSSMQAAGMPCTLPPTTVLLCWPLWPATHNQTPSWHPRHPRSAKACQIVRKENNAETLYIPAKHKLQEHASGRPVPPHCTQQVARL
jgi:hypothetical protein